MQRAMRGFHQDAEGHWVAELSCGHGQHVRHQPPFTLRPWVLTEQGRAERIGQCLECVACDRRELPRGYAPYRRTPTFTRDTLPRALLERHDTKAGVWALLHVVSGSLTLVELEPEREQHQEVAAGQHAVIRPEVEHRVALRGDVEVYLELWRAEPRAATAMG
jgi:tellurite methyltransferase